MESVARAGGTAGARAGCTVRTSQILDQIGAIHVDVDSVGENLADIGVALPGDTRAAPRGGVWVAPLGRVWNATLKLDRPIVRVLPVHNDGGVSRYQA